MTLIGSFWVSSHTHRLYCEGDITWPSNCCLFTVGLTLFTCFTVPDGCRPVVPLPGARLVEPFGRRLWRFKTKEKRKNLLLDSRKVNSSDTYGESSLMPAGLRRMQILTLNIFFKELFNLRKPQSIWNKLKLFALNTNNLCFDSLSHFINFWGGS